MTLSERRVQGRFYRRLAREGHRLDDVRALPDGTFEDSTIRNGERAGLVPLAEAESAAVAASPFETARADFWRRVSAAVEALPRVYPRRRFLVAWASSGNLLGAARASGLTRKAGRVAVRKLLQRMRATGADA